MTSPGGLNKVVISLITFLGKTPAREKVNLELFSFAGFSSILRNIWLLGSRKLMKQNPIVATKWFKK